MSLKPQPEKPASTAAPPAPEPLTAPPQPKGVGSLRVLKVMHATWVAAGGSSIYGPT